MSAGIIESKNGSRGLQTNRNIHASGITFILELFHGHFRIIRHVGDWGRVRTEMRLAWVLPLFCISWKSWILDSLLKRFGTGFPQEDATIYSAEGDYFIISLIETWITSRNAGGGQSHHPTIGRPDWFCRRICSYQRSIWVGRGNIKRSMKTARENFDDMFGTGALSALHAQHLAFCCAITQELCSHYSLEEAVYFLRSVRFNFLVKS